jgi:hypothetical protein
MQGDVVLFVNLNCKRFLQTGFRIRSKDISHKWTVDCRPIASGASWKAREFDTANVSSADDL